jgi:uncharacterized protein
VPHADRLSRGAARRVALAAQGFADPRPAGKVDRRHLRRVLDHVGLIQIDSVNVLARSQELVLFARLGPHRRDLITAATDAGELFEYWVHMASHVPTEDLYLYRWAMEVAGEQAWREVREIVRRRPGFVEDVYARVAEGPVVAADLSVREGRKGPWWDWDDAKLALEYLFRVGRVTAYRRARDFARVYDLPERRIPTAALVRPGLSERDARKELLVRAARAHGVGTPADLADYHRQAPAACRPLLAELVAERRLIPTVVEGWSDPAYRHPEARVPRRITGCALLSPFDPVVWFRPRTERLFGFHYRIEIYTPAHRRVHGYFVLPVLLDGELVGRVDLKADRGARVLRVHGVFAEPGISPPAMAAPLAAELRAMAAWLGLDEVVVSPHGDAAGAVAVHVGHGAR